MKGTGCYIWYGRKGLSHIYLGAVAFGVTLLVASFVLGGKDVHHGGDAHADAGLGWAPVLSLRFWIFAFTFGGAAGLALTELESSTTIAAVGAGVIGWVSGALAVSVIRSLTKKSVSSDVRGADLVGATGVLLLPAGPTRPGKVRVEIKGRSEDFVATVVDDGGELPTGAHVLVISEGDRGALIVAKHDV